MSLGITNVLLSCLAAGQVGAEMGSCPVPVERGLSILAAAALVLAVIFLPLLLAGFAMRHGAESSVGRLRPRDAVQPNNTL